LKTEPASPVDDCMQASGCLGSDGALASEVPGFAARPQQQQMADVVERALEQGEALIVEAGTGTGKTFAYLVPALLSGQKVIISCSTVIFRRCNPPWR